MGRKDIIISCLKSKEGFICDDCLSDLCNIFPRQSVYQVCNELYIKGTIMRESNDCILCGKTKKCSSYIKHYSNNLKIKDSYEENNYLSNSKLNHTGTIILETESLVLRRFTNDDTLAVYNNWTSDSEVSKYMRWEHHKNIEETKAKINDWLKRYSNNNFYQWAIALKGSDEPIGAIGLFVVNEGDLCGDFGYSISRKYWGRGIASEALKAVLKFAFETIGFNRIESYHSINNPASGKVMLKAGMKLEGLARQKYKSNVGFEDSYMYSILKEDYQ